MNPLLTKPAQSASSRSYTMFVTRRLVMRRPVPGDAEPLFPAFSDAEVMRWWSRPPFTDVEELRAGLMTSGDGSWRNWTVTRTADHQVIGFVGAAENRHVNVSEISYLMIPQVWKLGFASEAVSGLVDLLFSEGQRRVYADADPDNPGSCALLEKLGFRLEGRLRGEWHTHIGIRDALFYGLLSSEWRQAT